MRVVTNHQVKEFKADGADLVAVVVENRATGSTEEWKPDGVFVFIELIPNTGFAAETISLDQAGFIQTNDHFATNVPGVFAAGDVRSGATKQAVAAMGEGTAAAIMMRDYLRKHGETNDGHAIERELVGETHAG